MPGLARRPSPVLELLERPCSWRRSGKFPSEASNSRRGLIAWRVRFVRKLDRVVIEPIGRSLSGKVRHVCFQRAHVHRCICSR